MHKMLNQLLFFLASFPIYGLQLPSGSYQDIYVNGNILLRGYGPDCNSRYQAIKKVLDLYRRPIVLLDIGAAEGYFSLRIAHEYDARAVMIGHPEYRGDFLQRLCLANTEVPAVFLLSRQFSAHDLTVLAEREHFDVVLALNIIHNLGDDWQEAFDAILQLGDNVIIETPPNEDTGAFGQTILASINARIDQMPSALLGRFARLHTDPNQFDRLVWISAPHYIDYADHYRSFHGIQQETFKSFNGIYP